MDRHEVLRSLYSKRAALIALLLALAVLAALRQTHDKGIRNPNDFVTLYAGSFCITHRCNPYSVPDLDSVLVLKRGTDVRQDWYDQLPIYPPTTLFLLLPLAFLPYKAAMLLWYGGSLVLYAFGLCWTYFASNVRLHASLLVRVVAVLLGLHFSKILQCLGFGNPAVAVTGLLLFSLFDTADSRRWLRYVAVAVACLLKPPLALPLASLMFLREPNGLRRACIFAGSLAGLGFAIYLAAGLPGGMAHWRPNLRNNIALGEHNGMNPSLRASASNAILNLANLPGYFTHNTLIIQVVSVSILAFLSLFFLVLIVREPALNNRQPRAYLLAVASLSALTLLPVYHRFCDIGVLLLVVPWVIAELRARPSASSRRPWQAWASAAALCLLYFSWERRIHLDRFTGKALAVIQFLYYRGDALLVLLLACILLSAMAASTSSATARQRI